MLLDYCSMQILLMHFEGPLSLKVLAAYLANKSPIINEIYLEFECEYI